MGPTSLGANSKVGRVAKENKREKKEKERLEQKKKNGRPGMGRSKLCTSKWGPPYFMFAVKLRKSRFEGIIQERKWAHAKRFSGQDEF